MNVNMVYSTSNILAFLIRMCNLKTRASFLLWAQRESVRYHMHASIAWYNRRTITVQDYGVGRLDYPLQGAGLVGGIKRPCCWPDNRAPILAKLTRSKGMRSIVLGVELAARVTGKRSMLTANRLRNSNLPRFYILLLISGL